MKALLILLLLMLTPAAYGFNIDHVTFNKGPYRIEYTGIWGALIDEYESILTKEWNNELHLRYQAGLYDEVELSIRQREAAYVFAAARYGNWWQRSWRESLVSAPRKQVIISGPTRDIMDLGFARITNKWKFKLKEYETEIVGKHTGHSQLFTGWKFKFSPTVDVSIRSPFVRSAALRFRFTWIELDLQLVRIDINAGYSIRHDDGFVEIIASLVQW